MKITTRTPTIASRSLVVVALALGACTSLDDGSNAVDIDTSTLLPRLVEDSGYLTAADPAQLRRLDLVATNLVSALVQVPELDPAGTTLQLNPPVSAFGAIVMRALEDAGYGIQVVKSDQGRRYVSYSERYALTERGPVVDFALFAGDVGLSREYVQRGESIYPGSLMTLSGSTARIDLTAVDEAFRVQGDAGAQYVSGLREDDGGIRDSSTIDTIDVRDYDARPATEGGALEGVLEQVREQAAERAATRPDPDLDTFERHRRAVLIFDTPTTEMMGEPNKRAVRLMVRELVPGDLIVVRACHDADGRDQAAQGQAARVVEELASHEVSPDAWWIAPCRRAAYQLAAGQPSPVELVHYRPRT